jgi:hypothetical protein
MRIRHEKYGLGVILEEFTSGGGSKVARVIFDARPDEERTILRSVLSDSKAPMPEAAKPTPKRKPRKSKPEAEPESVGEPADELLVPEKTAHILPQLDELPDESADMDEVPVQEEDCTETV